MVLIMRASIIAVVLALALPLAACAQRAAFSKPGLTPAAGPLFITAFNPPPEYARWYANMEECLGLKGDFEELRWFVVPAPWRGGDSENLTYAFWAEPHRIILNAQGWRDSLLVEHEAVHDILSHHDLQPDMAHPMPYFDGRCSSEFVEGKP